MAAGTVQQRIQRAGSSSVGRLHNASTVHAPSATAASRSIERIDAGSALIRSPHQ